MGKPHTEIGPHIRQFIEAQRMFFVATAPLGREGHVNLSPKGLDTLRVLGPRRVAYLDFNGSGIETVAHIRENGRLTIMFCAFEGKPNIVRLYGNGRVVEPHEAEFSRVIEEGRFDPPAAIRSIIVQEIARVTESCGFGVPLFEFKGHRDQLIVSAQRKGADGLRAYQREKNAVSIDGLPGLPSACGGADPASGPGAARP